MTKCVLVIDDDLGTRESLRLLLTPEFEVVCADSVTGGLRLLAEDTVALVISDLRTRDSSSGMDGLRAIRELDPGLPVIMLTGYGTPEAKRLALDLGASAFIVKPFEMEGMREAVRRHAR